MQRIRVLVVEDSLTVRRHLVGVLEESPGFEVVGEAADGKAGIELCARLRPDVVTMDMMLPMMTGLAATEYIMAYCPTPILIVSASTNRGEVFRTYDALAAGAVDVLEKPLGTDSDAAWEQSFLSALRVVSRVSIITHPRAKLSGLTQHQPRSDRPLPVLPQALQLIAIGASTGGPGAVLTIMKSLPESFRIPMLLVMHIAESFAADLAAWLGAQTTITVRYAKDGDPLPRPGERCVVMAPPNRHLIVVGERLRLSADAERHSCRPSVDVMFESLALDLPAGTAGCLLTGMGRDGAAGLLAMRHAGALTLAQDEASSVVFGMPGEAIRLGAAAAVLPLDEVAPFLVRATHEQKGATGGGG